MKHAKPTRAWRPIRAHTYERRRSRPEGVWSALVFNLCLFLLPMAAAAAVIIIARDQLYAYEYTDASARAISARVERLNAGLVRVDFDRQRQWDNMVSMELMANDPSAARGFLLSGTEMLPSRSAAVLRRAAADGAGDAAIEVAALQLLLPGTRERYQASVQLLSLRPTATPTAAHNPATLGDPRDFELMARALLSEPETDPVQFVLTGFSLGLAGEMSAAMNQGAVALLAATRREDFPEALSGDLHTLVSQAVPIETFRAAAEMAAEGRGDAGAFDNASVAFAASVNPAAAAQLRAALAEIGEMAAATSPASASTLLTHAQSTADFPRLRLLAQTAGDRVAAAAKRLPRDGRLLLAARGELAFNRDLTFAVVAAAAALVGLVLVVLFNLVQAVRNRMRPSDEDDYGYEDEYESELLEISTNNWRPL